MKKLMSTIVLIFLLSVFVSAQSKSAKQAEEEKILGLIEMQRQTWNAGDLEKFMTTYWSNDSLMFIGKSGVTYGWERTLNNYKKSYPDSVSMGKLNFEILEVKRLSVMYFFVVGKWHLTRSIGNVGGHFTLLFKKVKNKWVIVADHSS